MNETILRGTHWVARRVDGFYILSIKDQSSLHDALLDFISTQGLTGGEVTGVGAVNEATLRFYDPETKNYLDKTFSEQMELVNLSGNIAIIEGVRTVHHHATLGRRDYSALAGHLLDAKIRGACELFVFPANSEVQKVPDEKLGLAIYDFTP